jgi:hypothetical protein
MAGAHPGLDGAEGVLDGLAPPAHGLRVLVEAALDGFKNIFVFPAADAALPAGGALALDGAGRASGRPVPFSRKIRNSQISSFSTELGLERTY